MPISELVPVFLAWCAPGRAAATVRFYRQRLAPFVRKFGGREFSSLSLIEITAYLAEAGDGKSDSTRRHNAVALERLQQFALAQQLLERPIFGKLEKPPMGQRDRLPTETETAALLKHASPAFRLIYSALRQSGARPGELCRATIANLERGQGSGDRGQGNSLTPDPCPLTPNPDPVSAYTAIVLKEHKTARKTKKPRRIPIGKKLAALLTVAIGGRSAGPLFLSPAGKAWSVPNLSRTYRRLRDRAGLPRDLVLYLARHECGSKVCKAQGIEAARRILGHANISTTTRYVHYDDAELQAIQDGD